MKIHPNVCFKGTPSTITIIDCSSHLIGPHFNSFDTIPGLKKDTSIIFTSNNENCSTHFEEYELTISSDKLSDNEIDQMKFEITLSWH